MAAGSAKRSRGGGTEGSPNVVGDRLSALPDCLLHEIMSYLKARQVVQTCVLSKWWTHLWRSVPCLGLNVHDTELRGTAAVGDHVDNFANFVDNLLLFHDAPTLDAFRLRFDGAGTWGRSRDADRWIRRAIKYGPSVLEVCFGVQFSNKVQIPGLGTCSRRLKRLHLSGVSLDASFAPQIQSGCPVLEDLELKSCCCKFREITSRTLKILKLDGCYIGIPVLDDRDGFMVITVPALVSLHLVVCSFQFSVNEATNLVQASIGDAKDYCMGIRIKRNLPKLLDGLSSVKNLMLTSLETMVLEDMSEKFPAFNNLKTLFLHTCKLGNQTLGHFLNSSPNLEKLKLQHCMLSEGLKIRVSRRKIKSMKRTLKCQNLLSFECANLKLIEIKGRGSEAQRVYDYVFGIRKNLQKTTIVLMKE